MIKFSNYLQIKNCKLKIRTFRSDAGFTLLELLISLAIVMSVSGAIAFLFIDIFSSNNFLRESFFSEREVNAVIHDMVQEIRTATASSAGGYLLEKAEPFSIAFYTNLNKDTQRERVHYFISGTDLKKSVVWPAGSPLTYATTTATESVKTVLSNIVASSTMPLFSYFNKNYGGTSTPMTVPISVLDVRLVRITLTVDKSATDTIPPLVVGSEVGIRNLKYVQ